MTTRATANSLSTKLQEFSKKLTPAEQSALGDILLTFGNAATRPQPTGRGLVAPAGSEKAIADVKKLIPGLGGTEGGSPQAITPTITTITITTTVASHPVITCSKMK